MRVLVVEDDPAVAAFVSQGLREASFAVDVADDGLSGRRKAGDSTYDVIVLDLMLPGMDGFDLLRELRQMNVAAAVICLTARDTVEDRVRGLNLGADDYLVKPFSFSELLARVHALLRRGQAVQQNPISVGDLTIDVLTRGVQRAGRRLDLSPREYALLEYLGRNAGQVLTRTMILEHVWDVNQDPLTNVLETHINRLRKKVDQGSDYPLIHTVRGVGYVLRNEREQ